METFLLKRIGDFSRYCWEEFAQNEEEAMINYPDDFYVELVRPIYEWEMGRINSEIKKELTQEQSDKLRERNKVINDVDVLSQENALYFLNNWFLNIELNEDFLKDLVSRQWYEILKEFSEDLANKYIDLFLQFSDRSNLRYTLRKNSRNEYVLQLRPEIVALEDLTLLKKAHPRDYEKFSREFSQLLTDSDAHVYAKILKESSDLVESISNFKAGTKSKTLTDAIKEISPVPFPHATVKQSLEKLYGFYSDYKGIRHGGGTTGLRQLEEKDATHLSLITALFASYLIKN